MKVVIKQWVPVGVWKWNLNGGDDVCGICRVHFEGTCPSCVRPGLDCPPVSGDCTHSFHRHCVEKWLLMSTSEGRCPMCRQRFTSPDLPANVLASSEAFSEDEPFSQDASLELPLP